MLINYFKRHFQSFQTKCKVHIFGEGHKILQNLHRRFDDYYIGQVYCGDFEKNSKDKIINIQWKPKTMFVSKNVS